MQEGVEAPVLSRPFTGPCGYREWSDEATKLLKSVKASCAQ